MWNELWTECLQTYEVDKPQCVLHAMADMINENSSSDLPQMNEKCLRGIFFNFVAAGKSTISASAHALLNILLHHPQVLLKLQHKVETRQIVPA